MIWLLAIYFMIGLGLYGASAFLIPKSGPLYLEVASFAFLTTLWPVVIIYAIWDVMRR